MGKMYFKCSSCNWRFGRNFKPEMCPYCGKNSLEDDTTQSAADDLLKDSAQFNW